MESVAKVWTGKSSGDKSGKAVGSVRSGAHWRSAVDRLRAVNFMGEYSKDAGRREYLRSLIKRANKGTAASRPASKASRLLRFTPSTLYFLILEKDWWFCCFLASLFYAIPVTIFGLLSMTLELQNDTADVELALHDYVPSQALVAFRFSSANIIGMGYGTVVPTSNEGFFLAIISQLLGIMINVFVFAAVMAKFQSPRADIIFSDKICLFTRDGVRHLCLRVGNLRCHTLYSPSLRVFVLKEQGTSEGEDFVQSVELSVEEPGTVSGFYNITHRIDGSSPLYDLRAEDMRVPDNILAFQVIFTAVDPVYQAEVCAKCSYSTNQLEFGKRFGDMMKYDARGKRFLIDFTCFEDFVDAPEYWEEEEAIFIKKDLPMENGEAPPEIEGDKPGLLLGFGRESFGDPLLDGDLPRGGLRPQCCFALSVAMTLLEAGDDYEEYRSDLADKPTWHAKVDEKLETPALRLPRTSEWLDGTDRIIETLVEKNAKVAELARCEPGEGLDPSNAHWEVHAHVFALCLVHAPKAVKMRAFFWGKFGCDEAWPAHKCEAHLQSEAMKVLRRWESALKERQYLCGSRPGLLDCRAAPKLFLAFSLADSGLGNLGKPFKELAPRAFHYLNRFSKRPSWKRAYGPGRGVRVGPDIITVRTLANKFVTLAPTTVDSVILPALEKARNRKVERKPRERAERRNSAALCL
ncbi:inward rectifying potassium channel transporter [Chloropicon primus]|uniref:Inward rectifying potassium channel transporter n=1 Tax=Chloropicon primus TaxID=1764295 RepID=A0A5B8MRV9_9CHLO|nr:inward rectifying potassium channel transporter [Chloropicon primus]UPR01368.1 inward rectifying potassium channel transporter [Chloropicon primus]|eukprot:QDZ22150.1 inward rectifying potassium channel transporter [Chloropicon primus]